MIAEKHGVKPATARSWLHQARRLGLLGPAADRAAGEVGAPSILTRKSRAEKQTAEKELRKALIPEREMDIGDEEEEVLFVPEDVVPTLPVEESAEEPAREPAKEPAAGGRGTQARRDPTRKD